MKRPLKSPVKFEKGIRYATRQRTTKQAEKQFDFLYLSIIREFQIANRGNVNEALAQQRLRENKEGFREKGFELEFLESLRREYDKLPRRAPRKKIKIKFDANGIPKVTKTPLDPRVSALLALAKVTKSG